MALRGTLFPAPGFNGDPRHIQQLGNVVYGRGDVRSAPHDCKKNAAGSALPGPNWADILRLISAVSKRLGQLLGVGGDWYTPNRHLEVLLRRQGILNPGDPAVLLLQVREVSLDHPVFVARFGGDAVPLSVRPGVGRPSQQLTNPPQMMYVVLNDYRWVIRPLWGRGSSRGLRLDRRCSHHPCIGGCNRC
ncbi:unnamed protein product [Pieris macdunnoughi]|uniref:Uncharacterized protein n=1 Tax=Pieris macdunnoughi TaxID=345717 RepID=A0A821XS41_9NEOP|nr:unnamed protein product [Pieris macdunnoughi]